MINVGFIAEGDTEYILLKSDMFRGYLRSIKIKLRLGF